MPHNGDGARAALKRNRAAGISLRDRSPDSASTGSINASPRTVKVEKRRGTAPFLSNLNRDVSLEMCVEDQVGIEPPLCLCIEQRVETAENGDFASSSACRPCAETMHL